MEYKFRGFDATGQKGWVYGDLVHNKKVTRTGLEDRVMVGGYEVVPESVGLWIGINDCNGKPVFEGDILCTVNHRDFLVKVEYDTDYMRFIGSGIRRNFGLIFIRNSSSTIEIVGNIFENKELLKY